MNNKKASSHKTQLNILLFSLLTLALLGFLSFNTYRLNRVTQETGMTDEYLIYRDVKRSVD